MGLLKPRGRRTFIWGSLVWVALAAAEVLHFLGVQGSAAWTLVVVWSLTAVVAWGTFCAFLWPEGIWGPPGEFSSGPLKRKVVVVGVALLALGFGGYGGLREFYQHALEGPCDGPLACRSGLCIGQVLAVAGVVARGAGYCTADCNLDSDCPKGWRCKPMGGPDTEDRELVCRRGKIQHLGDPCIGDDECLSGYCQPSSGDQESALWSKEGICAKESLRPVDPDQDNGLGF